jgi:hypothetical protein
MTQWNDLPAGHSYTVAEANTPSGYTVSMAQSGNNFVITNTHTPPATPPKKEETPPGGNTPPTGSSETPPEGSTDSRDSDVMGANRGRSGSGSEGPGGDVHGANRDRIPQTGAQWWIVIYTASCGLFCLVIGLWRRQKAD